MKFIVAQIGSRHHYAIPRMLVRADCLEALYTDACASRGLGRVCDTVLPSRLRPGSVKTLLQRRIQDVPRDKVRCTDRLLLGNFFGQSRKLDAFTAQVRAGSVFSQAMLGWGFGQATGVYSMFGEGLEFLRAAKARGLRIVVDVFITPVAHRIISAERAAFPAWEGGEAGWDERLETRIREILELADMLLCPGQNVVEGVRAFGESLVGKTRVVPYGSGTNFAGKRNEPTIGRVLFGGTAELRKGIHYFAAAARQLLDRGVRAEFLVAGNVADRIRSLPECAALKFLGRIPRDQMQEELLRADVLVLPTLAEGSASVITEALVAGLPVITTQSAGALVVHGENGLIIPERGISALAEAISSVIEDRGARNHLADGARQSSSQFSESAWADRLVQALTS